MILVILVILVLLVLLVIILVVTPVRAAVDAVHAAHILQSTWVHRTSIDIGLSPSRPYSCHVPTRTFLTVSDYTLYSLCGCTAVI